MPKHKKHNYTQMLSSEQFLRQKWIKEFRKFDADHDGKLTRNDFEEMGERLAEATPSDEAHKKAIKEKIAAIWEKMFNHDGKTGEMDQDAFLENLSEQTSEGLTKICREYCPLLFQAVDTDGDGFIQFSEYKNFFYLVFQDDKEARASFDTIDTNKDGILSLEEFTNAWIEFLTGENQQSPYRLMLGPLD